MEGARARDGPRVDRRIGADVLYISILSSAALLAARNIPPEPCGNGGRRRVDLVADVSQPHDDYIGRRN